MGRMISRIATIVFLLISWGFMVVGKDTFGAETPEKFYQGKTLNWIVASEPGDIADLMVKTISPFLTKKIAARIKFEYRKTDEGMNYLYKQGTRDGLTLAVKTTDTIIGSEIMKAPGVLYETDKFNFVADIYPSVKVFQISPKNSPKTLDALRKIKGLRGGGTSNKGSIAVSTAVMFEILGLDGKIITGFKGKKELTLAMARGEIDCMVTSDSTAMRDERDGYVVTLMTTGDKRSVVVPNVPSLSELGVTVPKEMGSVHKYVTSGGNAVVLPPGVPQERVEYLRKIFQILSNNRDLQKAMEKLTGASTAFVSGKELQQEMADIKSDKELANKLDAIFNKYSAVR